MTSQKQYKSRRTSTCNIFETQLRHNINWNTRRVQNVYGIHVDVVRNVDALKTYVFKKKNSYSGQPLFHRNFNLSRRKLFLAGTRIPTRKITPTLLKPE